MYQQRQTSASSNVAITCTNFPVVVSRLRCTQRIWLVFLHQRPEADVRWQSTACVCSALPARRLKCILMPAVYIWVGRGTIDTLRWLCYPVCTKRTFGLKGIVCCVISLLLNHGYGLKWKSAFRNQEFAQVSKCSFSLFIITRPKLSWFRNIFCGLRRFSLLVLSGGA